jgi:hypothetical protein
MKSNSSTAELRDIGLGKNGLVKFEFKLKEISPISQMCSGITCGLWRQSSGARSVRKCPVAILVIYYGKATNFQHVQRLCINFSNLKIVGSMGAQFYVSSVYNSSAIMTA